MSDELLKLVAKVKRGSNRKKVFLAMEDGIMPSELVKKIYGTSSITHLSIVSRALAELKELGLVEVVNPKEKTGRVYRLTSTGEKIKELL